MKKLIYILLLSLLPIVKVGAQEIVEHLGDTIVTITPENLKTINSIIVDLESSKEIIRLQKNIIQEDSLIKLEKDSIINYQWSIQKTKDSYYIESIDGLKKSIEKEKRKKKTLVGVLGSVAAILGIIAICK